jgi:site-specific recombinase XerD
VHLLVQWLNSIGKLPPSLMSRDFSEWRGLYRDYLTDRGMYKRGTTNRMSGKQKPCVTPRDSPYISTLRQTCALLKRAYDPRPEREKDVWDLKRMGVYTNLSQSNVKLSFLIIDQKWLRTAVKSYLSYCLPLYSESTCRTRVQSLACFSKFFAAERPRMTSRSITRRLLLEYVSHLHGRIGTATAKNHVLNLRNFLEMAHREGWLAVLEIARIIQEQQAEGRNRNKPSLWLFPNERGGVDQAGHLFAHRINRLAYDHDIRDATGKLFRFQAHQFRHTVGTRMINLGVPHHIIQRYLGHKGPEMTSRYAHIHDTTMKDKLSEYLKGTLIDVSGKVVSEDGVNDSADLQWFTRSVLAQALTNGYCAIPIVAGPCPHRTLASTALTSARTPPSSKCIAANSTKQSESSRKRMQTAGCDKLR